MWDSGRRSAYFGVNVFHKHKCTYKVLHDKFLNHFPPKAKHKRFLIVMHISKCNFVTKSTKFAFKCVQAEYISICAFVKGVDTVCCVANTSLKTILTATYIMLWHHLLICNASNRITSTWNLRTIALATHHSGARFSKNLMTNLPS